jgi:TraM recognition site of TraD and TraG/Type IV secretion-system coupling protein DNA-binding domain
MSSNLEFPNYKKQVFASKDEEIEYLKSVIHQKTQEMGEVFVKSTESKENLVSDILKKYKDLPKQIEVHKEMMLPDSHITILSVGLSPEEHDDKVQRIIDIFVSEGIANTFAVLDKIADDHLSDDFHRFLVQYVLNYESSKNFGNFKETKKSAERSLFEIILQSSIGDDKSANDPKILIALMERFYAGMIAISSGKKPEDNKEYLSIEIAKPQGDSHIRFFVSVPNQYIDLLSKQILALYPKAKVIEQKNDFNVFFEGGYSLGAVGKSLKTPALPIKRYTDFTSDPIAVIVSVFSKLKKLEEGAALQIVMRPSGERFLKDYGKILDKVRTGTNLKRVLEDNTFYGAVKNSIFDAFKETVNGDDKKEKEEKKTSYADEEAIKLINEKLNSTIIDTNIRLVTSGDSAFRTEQMMRELGSSFGQFSEAKGNSILFEEIKGKKMHEFAKHFIYRYFDERESFPLNLAELATICHFPQGLEEADFGDLKQYESKQAPVSGDMSTTGVLLGKNKYRGLETDVRYGREDRVRHFYTIGQTGTGKTTLLKNMIIQDIQNGDGVCFIDPHGADIIDILANIPKERIDDVIYFDPSDTTRPMGLNMLEYDVRYPEQKIFVVNELLAIFNKLFDMKVSGGPMFEQYFRNAAMLVMEHPESGSTLMEISRVMADSEFRALKLSHCQNPLVKQFWKAAQETSGEQGLENYVPYVTSKFDGFLSNDIMRPIIVQEKSSFNMKDIMDNKKIFLVNLSKGRLGEMNANLLGLILVGKILMAALSRDPKDNPADFYLYIDEFQNVTTDSISQILSEARKYRLSLNIAHQYIAQLQEPIKNAVFGNVGSMAVFRVSSEDATYLEKQFQPTFAGTDIMRLENRNAYVKLLSGGSPQKPFNIVTLPPSAGNKEIVTAIKELSSLKYGTKKEDIEAIIMKKFNI